MSLTLTRIESTEPPARPGWFRRHLVRIVGIVIASLVTLGGWQLVSAVKRVRVAASRMADT